MFDLVPTGYYSLLGLEGLPNQVFLVIIMLRVSERVSHVGVLFVGAFCRSVITEVMNNCVLGERKNMNLPGAIVDLPTLTEKVPVLLSCLKCVCIMMMWRLTLWFT